MGFYRIIKKTIKFILYQMPKKWLIMIIFALAMTFGLTQVKGYSFTNETLVDEGVNANSLTYYNKIMFKKPLVTDIVIDRYTNFDFKVNYKNFPKYIVLLGFGNNNYDTDLWGVKPNLFYLQNPNNSGNKRCSIYINGSSSAGYIDFGRDIYFDNSSMDVRYYTNYVIENNVMNSTYSADITYNGTTTNASKSFTNNLSNTSNSPLVFCLYGGDCFYISHFITTGQELHNLYPVKYGSKVGLYDFNTEKLYYFTNSNYYTLGSVISKPNVNINPYITNNTEDIENYSFSYLDINGNSLKDRTDYGQNYFSLVTNYMGISVTTELENFKQVNGNSVTFSVPKSELIDNPSIATGRSVNWTLLYYKSVEGGRDIIEYDLGTYTFDLSNNTQQENDTIQQDTTLSAIAGVSSSIDNLNNSVTDLNNTQQETNNFLKDTNVNSNNKNIPSPTIENSQVISQIDNAYSSFFEDYLLLFASDLPVTIDLYIPNMATGGIASTISIPSNYVKAHLSSLSIPFINYSMLELVYMVWYVLFAFWFLGFATNLITILYSGEIMQDKGLSKLTKTYTGVSKNML